jgi:hypothetical protein
MHSPIESIDDSPPFEALSYVLGVTSTMHGSRRWTVHHLLELQKALLRLRQSHAGKRLWTDATCIDQSDIPERNVLMPMMKEMYSKADAVNI